MGSKDRFQKKRTSDHALITIQMVTCNAAPRGSSVMHKTWNMKGGPAIYRCCTPSKWSEEPPIPSGWAHQLLHLSAYLQPMNCYRENKVGADEGDKGTAVSDIGDQSNATEAVRKSLPHSVSLAGKAKSLCAAATHCREIHVDIKACKGTWYEQPTPRRYGRLIFYATPESRTGT